jgi:hypothetical protein
MIVNFRGEQMIETITNSPTEVKVDSTDSFTSLFSNRINTNIQKAISDEIEVPIDETAIFDFNNFLNSLQESDETLEMRQLMINELKRQGISDPIAYLGKGGVDITMRLAN